MTRFIESAAAARAALTVDFVTDTPSRRSATSGLITTWPVPLTLIVCSGVWSVAASAFRGAKTGLATAATTRPSGEADADPADAGGREGEGDRGRLHGVGLRVGGDACGRRWRGDAADGVRVSGDGADGHRAAPRATAARPARA